MFNKIIRLTALILVTSSPLFSQDVWLRLEVGERRKLNITIDNFQSILEMESMRSTVKEIIEKDLKFSLYFKIVEDAVTHISGDITENELCITVYEMPRKTKIMEKRYHLLLSNIREACHTVSDDIIRFLAGENGISRTKVFFLKKMKDDKKIVYSDYDGFNATTLDINDFCVSLAVSPNCRKIAYSAYNNDNLYLYLYDFETKYKELISDKEGLNTAPAFSADGKRIVFTLSKDGNTEIYIMNLKTKETKRLTFNRSIDTSPTWSPTGREIAFVSDRSGSPQIYIMESDGSGVRRLTYNGYYNTSPRWSPKGDKIAYVAMDEDNRLNIYTILITGEGRTCLTFQGNNEEPSWSMDGLHITFISNRNGLRELFTMHWDGSGQRKILTYGGGLYSSRWSQ